MPAVAYSRSASRSGERLMALLVVVWCPLYAAAALAQLGGQPGAAVLRAVLPVLVLLGALAIARHRDDGIAGPLVSGAVVLLAVVAVMGAPGALGRGEAAERAYQQVVNGTGEQLVAIALLLLVAAVFSERAFRPRASALTEALAVILPIAYLLWSSAPGTIGARAMGLAIVGLVGAVTGVAVTLGWSSARRSGVGAPFAGLCLLFLGIALTVSAVPHLAPSLSPFAVMNLGLQFGGLALAAALAYRDRLGALPGGRLSSAVPVAGTMASMLMVGLAGAQTAMGPAEVALAMATAVPSAHAYRRRSQRTRAKAGQVAGPEAAAAPAITIPEDEDGLAMTDALTGLANQRAFDRMLGTAADAARAEGRSLGVVVLTLHNVRAIGAEHGGAARDEVIQQAAQRLQRVLGSHGVPARTSSGELAVLFHQADANLLASWARALRATVVKEEIQVRGGAWIGVVGSAGAALMPEHARDVAGLLEAARNRRVAQPPRLVAS